MQYTIKSPLTSAPKKITYHSVKTWDKYKTLMITMRKEGKTAEDIRAALRREGFKVGIAPIKTRLSAWVPKNSSYRRKAVSAARRNTTRVAEEEEEHEKNGPATESAGDIVMEDAPGEYPSAREHMIRSDEAADGNELEHQPIADDRGLDQNSIVNPEPIQQHKNDDTEELIDIATQILGTLGLSLDIGDQAEADCPSFEEWEARQFGTGGTNTPGVSEGDEPAGDESYSFEELLKMADELGEIHRIEEIMVDEDEVDENGLREDTVDEDGSDEEGSNEEDFDEDDFDEDDIDENYRNATRANEDERERRREVIEAAQRLQLKSGELHAERDFLGSFFAARDSFELLEKLRPLENFGVGMSLYYMGWALLKLARRFAEVTRILKLAREHFRVAKDITWELKLSRCIAEVQWVWPASVDQIRDTNFRLLDRIKNLSPSELNQIPPGDLPFIRTRALSYLAKLLPKTLAWEMMERMNSSSAKTSALLDAPTQMKISHVFALSVMDLGRYKEAAEKNLQLYDLSTSLYGPYHSNTLQIARDLHYCLVRCENFQGAAAIYHKISPAITRAGAWTARPIVNVGRMLSGLGHQYQALKLLQRGLYEFRISRPEGYFGIIETEEWIADALYKRGLVLYAQPIALDYMNRCEKWLGKNHPWTLDAILLCAKMRIGLPSSGDYSTYEDLPTREVQEVETDFTDLVTS